MLRLDTETLLPAIIGMSMYLGAAKMSLQTESDNDLVKLMKVGRDHHMTGVLFIGVVILLANEIASRY